MKKNPVIGLVDDHAVVRRGLRDLLRDTLEGCTVHEGANCKEARDLVSAHELDILVLDMHLPDGNALDLIPQLLAQRAGLRVLVFSISPDDVFAEKLAQLGAFGYVNKQAEEDRFLEAVRKVLDGDHWFSPDLRSRFSTTADRRMLGDPFANLSVRELSVLNHLLEGLPLAVIARRLDLQQSTVATYKARLLDKLGVRNVLELQEKAKLYGRLRP